MKTKKRNKIISLVVAITLMLGFIPAFSNVETVQAASSVKLFGGAYTLSKVTGKSTETLKDANGEQVKITRYIVEKGATIKAGNRKAFSLTNLVEIGNESGYFDSYAKVDNKADWMNRQYELKYKTISFTGTSKFQFQYETNKEKMSLVESGEMLGMIFTDVKNTVIIQVGSGKGNYYSSAKVSTDTITVDGKSVKINQYDISYGDLCYSLNDLSAALKGSKSSFTYKANKGTLSITPYAKSSKTIKLLGKKSIKASPESIKLVNSLTGVTTTQDTYKVNNEYVIPLRALTDVLDVKFAINSSKITLTSIGTPFDSGTYSIKSALGGDYFLGILGGDANDPKAVGAKTGLLQDSQITTPEITKFQLKNVGGPWYKITNSNSGLSIVAAKDNKVTQQKDIKGYNELFKFESIGNDTYKIVSQTGNVFDVYGEKASHGAVVGLYNDKGSNNQKWSVVK